jgi:flagellin-like protein
MRKLLKNKKALSPVVAAIILIAVTVAVSIAVAAWMGQLTFTFMATEECKITGATINTETSGANTVALTILNTGTSDVTFSSATITGGGGTITIPTTGIAYSETGSTILEGGATEVITLTSTTDLDPGTPYSISIVTSKGNAFTTTETA